MEIIGSVIGAAFWIFIASIVVAGIWYAYARNREIQKTIRLAIEKGTQLDAEMIDTLVRRESGNPEDYYIGGIICLACGVGLPIFGYFIGKIEEEAFFAITGAGILVGFIGISLILCGKLIGRRGKTVRKGNHLM
jgi:dipeptide/tripeptide permease